MAARQELTPREVQVLQAYADTGSVKGAGEALDMQASTAASHLHSIRLKMRVSTSAQAVTQALRVGVIT
jgi:DNA-binding NarL/FixJ family response regulator